MEFTRPRSLKELLDDMHVLDKYYNCRQYQYEELPLPPIVLERMVFTPLTDAEITAKATALADKKIAQMIAEFEGDITFKIKVLENKNGIYANILTADKAELISKYTEITESYKAEAVKRGLVNSSSYIDGLANISAEKAQKITELETESAVKVAENTAEINALNTYKATAVSRFSNEKEYEIKKNFAEIKKSETDRQIEITKYNLGQKEKELKSSITNNANLMRLRLSYLQIIEKRMTEDQLILAGYFIDLIKVVDAYFYGIAPIPAFNEFTSTSLFEFYLGTFYGAIYTKYLNRKNAAV